VFVIHRRVLAYLGVIGSAPHADIYDDPARARSLLYAFLALVLAGTAVIAFFFRRRLFRNNQLLKVKSILDEEED